MARADFFFFFFFFFFARFVSYVLLVKAKLAPAVEIIVAVGSAAVLWFGARHVLDGRLTAGALVVFLLYLSKMYKPIRELSKMTDTYSRALVAFERINNFLAVELDVRDRPGATRAPRFRGAIELDHVTFGYGLRPAQPRRREPSRSRPAPSPRWSDRPAPGRQR